jgi:cob(I)alamin adenosyltransferase
MEPGLIHIYHGDGKGKTTAALGLTLRAQGSGYRIIFTQFMKSWPTSELAALNQLANITVLRGDIPSVFSWEMDAGQKAQVKAEHSRLFQEAVRLAGDGQETLLVLDEVIGACAMDLIDRQLVLGYIRNKPELLEVVMTGRDPDAELVECADYVSEIRKIKHPLEQGTKARKGIEW